MLVHRDDGYGLRELGRRLRDGDPDGVRAWIDLDGAVGHADLSLVQMLHTVRTGEPGFPRQFGRSFWEDLSETPVRAASFDALMGAQLDTQAVVAAYDWASLGHVVDVGGGNATLLVALLTANPDLRGTVVDLPGAVAGANRAIEAAGQDDRAGAVPGSFFDPVPPGAGGYVLSAILHDWDDLAAERILTRCADAAAPDGAVLVVDTLGEGDRTASTEMDLCMLTYFRGRERSHGQLAELAARAGLRVVSVVPAGWRSLAELRPTAARKVVGPRRGRLGGGRLRAARAMIAVLDAGAVIELVLDETGTDEVRQLVEEDLTTLAPSIDAARAEPARALAATRPVRGTDAVYLAAAGWLLEQDEVGLLSFDVGQRRAVEPEDGAHLMASEVD